MMYLTHLECADCSATYDASVEQHRCACGGVLLARYDLSRLAREVPREQIAARSWSAGLWRYAELLPVERPEDRVTLGEGATPLLRVAWLSAELGAEIWLKDEGLNPTGTFKARGAAVGVSRAKQLGADTARCPQQGTRAQPGRRMARGRDCRSSWPCPRTRRRLPNRRSDSTARGCTW